MNYREKMRKAIECPQFGNIDYGEWGTLRLDQRKNIKRLLDEMDRADIYIRLLYEEIDRLNKEYERVYNENCKLRENHNINDITLLDENERLNRIIDNIFKFMQNKYDNSDLTGFTISFMELQDLKELKENNNV